MLLTARTTRSKFSNFKKCLIGRKSNFYRQFSQKKETFPESAEVVIIGKNLLN